jgi:KDO2-lipid IV(A) lauroyltransferase
MKRVQYLVEYLLFEATAFVVQLLPLDVVRTVASRIGEMVFLLRYRTSVTLSNLANAYPSTPKADLEVLARKVYQSVAVTLFEMLWFPRITADELPGVIECVNAGDVRALGARGNGVILLTAHFGNWELLGQCMRFAVGRSISAVVKPQANPYVDAAINRRRAQFGNTIIPMDRAVREVLRTLHAGGVAGMLADQAAAKESLAVPFFGREVPTYQGPAVFALRTRAPLLLGFAVRQADGNYSATFQPVPMDDLQEYNEANIIELTRRHVAMTEKMIREYPEQWMWMHRRWKHVADRTEIAERS